MALSDEDRKEIQDLFKTSLSSLPTIIDEKLQSWMKTEVIPMVNGAKKGALVDVDEKLTELVSTIEEIKTSQAKQTGLSGEDIDKTIAASLEKILADSGDDAGKPGKDSKDNSGAAPFDVEKLKQELFKDFEGKHLTPLKQRVDAAEKAQADAEQEKQKLQQQQLAATRDQAFIETLGKSDLIANDAAKQAFRTLVDEGLIQLSEDGSGYVVKERDRYDQGDILVPAAERLEKLAEADQLKYYRPARGGSGTGSNPATNSTKSNPEFKVINPDDVDNMAPETVLEKMKSDPDAFLADLDKLATS